MTTPRGRPEPIASALANFLEQSGLRARVEQAAVIPQWAGLVGPQIASATEPLMITADGTLFVAVRTNAWMTELSLLEPELLHALGSTAAGARVARIRWQIAR